MGKRGRNEGTIHRRNDGRWAAAIDLGNRDGKRRRQYIYGRTRAEVAEKLKTALYQQQTGRPQLDETTTVESFLGQRLQLVAPSIRPRTLETYRRYVELHIVPGIGHIRLAQLRPADVDRLLAQRLANGLSPRTVGHIRRVLGTALNYALKHELVYLNAASLSTPPRLPYTELSVPTADDVPALLTAFHGDRLEAPFVIALATGARQGELLALRWSDWDPDRKTLRIAGALQRIDGELTRVEPKTLRATRTVVVPTFGAEALAEHRKRQISERVASPSWESPELIFTTNNGNPLDRHNVSRTFKRLVSAAGFPNLMFHGLRHCTASLLHAAGASPAAVADALGHSQITTTLDIYTHGDPNQQQDLADRLDSIVGA